MNDAPKGSAAYLAARAAPAKGAYYKATVAPEHAAGITVASPADLEIPTPCLTWASGKYPPGIGEALDRAIGPVIPAHPWVEGTPDLMAIVRLSGDLRAEAARLQPLERGATQATLARAVQVVTNIEGMARALRGHLEGMQAP